MYELARHPACQERLRKEIRAAKANLENPTTDRLSLEQLMSLPYLDAVTVSLVRSSSLHM